MAFVLCVVALYVLSRQLPSAELSLCRNGAMGREQVSRSARGRTWLGNVSLLATDTRKCVYLSGHCQCHVTSVLDPKMTLEITQFDAFIWHMTGVLGRLCLGLPPGESDRDKNKILVL